MILFLERLRLRREEKLAKAERKFLQRSCPHDYHAVKEWRYDCESWVEAYCPVCEHTIRKMRKDDLQAYRRKAQLREQFCER